MADKDQETTQDRFYESLALESYEEYAAMIDRILFQSTRKTHKRAPEEEALRKSYQRLPDKIAKSKKDEG